jgi:hypothetical protein
MGCGGKEMCPVALAKELYLHICGYLHVSEKMQAITLGKIGKICNCQ